MCYTIVGIKKKKLRWNGILITCDVLSSKSDVEYKKYLFNVGRNFGLTFYNILKNMIQNIRRINLYWC